MKSYKDVILAAGAAIAGATLAYWTLTIVVAMRVYYLMQGFHEDAETLIRMVK